MGRTNAFYTPETSGDEDSDPEPVDYDLLAGLPQGWNQAEWVNLNGVDAELEALNAMDYVNDEGVNDADVLGGVDGAVNDDAEDAAAGVQNEDAAAGAAGPGGPLNLLIGAVSVNGYVVMEKIRQLFEERWLAGKAVMTDDAYTAAQESEAELLEEVLSVVVHQIVGAM